MSKVPGPIENSIREKVTTSCRLLFGSDSNKLTITRKLIALLQPASILITNDSLQHLHHEAMRAQGGGSGETRMFMFHHWSITGTSEAVLIRYV